MTETLIKDSIYKVLSLFKPYGDLFEVCQTPGKYIPRLISITVTNFQATTVYWRRKKKRAFLTKNYIGSRKNIGFWKTNGVRDGFKVWRFLTKNWSKNDWKWVKNWHKTVHNFQFKYRVFSFRLTDVIFDKITVYQKKKILHSMSHTVWLFGTIVGWLPKSRHSRDKDFHLVIFLLWIDNL